MEQIIIDIGHDGEVSMEGKGFKGKSCDAAMGHFEKALGVVTERINKPEYHGRVKTHANQRA